jgi:hypothetical protein
MTSGRIASVIAAGALAAAAWAAAPGAIGPFSQGTAGEPVREGGKPLTIRHIPPHTRYTLVRDAEAGIVVKAEARRSASGLIHALDLPAADRSRLTWSWKAANLIAAGDVRRKEGDDYPVRIYVSFKYSPERLTLLEHTKYVVARILYGEYPPHAGLNYIWDARAPVGTIVPNPFTDRVRMIVVESGPERLGRWLAYERDIVTDYRQAFGEDPPPIAGVALMTDADNTGEEVVAYYGDIALSPKP